MILRTHRLPPETASTLAANRTALMDTYDAAFVCCVPCNVAGLGWASTPGVRVHTHLSLWCWSVRLGVASFLHDVLVLYAHTERRCVGALRWLVQRWPERGAGDCCTDRLTRYRDHHAAQST